MKNVVGVLGLFNEAVEFKEEPDNRTCESTAS